MRILITAALMVAVVFAGTTIARAAGPDWDALAKHMVNNDEPLLKWYSTWNVDAAAGTWSADPRITGTPPTGISPTVPSAAGAKQ